MNASKKHMEIYGRDKCVKIGIHNGKFHADDVLCVSLIRYFITKDVEIVRTRDEEILKKMLEGYNTTNIFTTNSITDIYSKVNSL